MSLLPTLYAVTLVLCMAPVLAASPQPVVVLGLPLGGKMPGPFPVCKMSEIGKNHRFCWVGEPFRGKKYQSGSIAWPGGDQRVKWAEHASLSVMLTKSFVLESFTVKAWYRDTDKIIETISARFGNPSYVSSPGLPFQGRNWQHRDAYVRLLCSRESDCEISFTYGPVARAAEEEAAKREAADKARRPTSI